jgi:hypothetical protein
MAKKTRKEKELAQLRREVEVLRAQLKGSNETPTQQEKPQIKGDSKKKVQKEKIQKVDPKYIKADLIKAGVLTVLAIGIILAAYIFRDLIPFL